LNYIQIHSNFDCSKKDLPGLENFEIKYGCQVFEERNHFFLGISPYSQLISNENLGKSRSAFEFRKLIKIASNGIKI
jgi:hypothetical protein